MWQNFTAYINIETGKWKTKNVSNYLTSKESYGSLKFNTCLMISFKFIHCLPPKQSKRSLSFTCNSLFKHNDMEMPIRLHLAKMRALSVKVRRTQVPWDKSAYFHPP